MASLSQIPIETLKGVGSKRAELFQRLGVFSVGALLRYYPRGYEDWRFPVPIAEAPFDAPCVIRATVMQAAHSYRIRGGMTLYKAMAADESGEVELVFFNNPYAAQALHEGEERLFYGKVGGNLLQRQMSAPEQLPVADNMCMHALYPLTAGLSNRMVLSAMRQAIALLPAAVNDPIPEKIRDKYGLLGLREAICAIHFPTDDQSLADARRRLAFEELLDLQIGLLRTKSQTQTPDDALRCADRTEAFLSTLPFTPTNAQREAVRDGIRDMVSGIPMRRLIQGDVGSGKTVIAAALCDSAIFSGLQAAVMAPTEILAEQHYKTFCRLLPNCTCALLTGSVTPAERKRILGGLADGSVSLVIGTHALLTETVRFAHLGLVVTDEQHRFGVAQRNTLSAKGIRPHLLVMSATPIPRTLALILYGDLDVSLLRELPSGRQPIRTYWVGSDKRERAFGFIRKQLAAGKQAYIVCPAVEENEQMPNLKAATAYFEDLQKDLLAGFRVGLLHGRMKGKEKERMMTEFSAGTLQALVATTVIEVGVDVPNATVILIENAERFGLSQLHQLRGRVGRGDAASHCILISDAENEEARQRLNAMVATTDGFRIAEEDLKLRGPGDFFGSRQHGIPLLQVADLVSDLPLLQQAQAAASEILAEDAQLTAPQHRVLKAEILRLFGEAFSDSLN